jgi:RND family efflux transporter MFP subunit
MQAHSVAQAKAALATAEVARSTAESDFQRTASLKERGAVSQAVFDQMKARLDGAEMGVRQAKAALSTAQQMSADTAVYSPIAGIVAERNTNVGEAVPPVVMTIQDISTLEVRARLPERALTRVKVGTKAAAHFQTGAERTIEVARLSPSIDTKTRTFEIVALLPNEDQTLKAGMLVELDFGRDAKPAPTASGVASARPGDAK